jgi:hypothetical protein
LVFSYEKFMLDLEGCDDVPAARRIEVNEGLWLWGNGRSWSWWASSGYSAHDGRFRSGFTCHYQRPANYEARWSKDHMNGAAGASSMEEILAVTEQPP